MKLIEVHIEGLLRDSARKEPMCYTPDITKRFKTWGEVKEFLEFEYRFIKKLIYKKNLVYTDKEKQIPIGFTISYWCRDFGCSPKKWLHTDTITFRYVIPAPDFLKKLGGKRR